MNEVKTFDGHLKDNGYKFAIVASRFNDFIVKNLIDGAIDALLRHGAAKNNLEIYKVPGAFEIPQITNIVAKSKKYDGIICLGCLIRGSTIHFELLANETMKSLTQVNLEHNIPIGFGILATDTIDQAIERAGTKAGNKGAEAALACLELVQLTKNLKN